MFGELVAAREHRRTLRDARDGRPREVLSRAPRPARRRTPGAGGRGRRCWPGSPARTAPSSVGTRDALYVDGHRVARGSTVEKADWDQDDGTLTVSEVGSWGERRPVHTIAARASPGCSCSWSASGSPPAWCCSGTCRQRPQGRPRDRPPRAPRATGRSPGSTSSRTASTPTIPRYGGWPRRRSRRPATRSGWPERDRRPRFRGPATTLLFFPGCQAIPCSSTGRAFGC